MPVTTENIVKIVVDWFILISQESIFKSFLSIFFSTSLSDYNLTQEAYLSVLIVLQEGAYSLMAGKIFFLPIAVSFIVNLSVP